MKFVKLLPDIRGMLSGLSLRHLSSDQQQKVQGKDLPWEDSSAWHVSGSHTANHHPQQMVTLIVFASPSTAVLTSKASTFSALRLTNNTTTISCGKIVP